MLFDNLGENEAELVNDDIDAGYHSVQCDGSGPA